MRSGIDAAAVDPAVRPQDDLFAHVNGRWLATTEIPADRGRYGTFDVLRETAEENVRRIIEEVAADAPPAGTVAAKVGDLYTSFMDERAVEALGVRPLDADLERVGAVAGPDDVVALTGELSRAGVLGLVMPFVNNDDRDPARYVVYLEQAGLGLPDEAYYREEQHADKRTAYVGHVERMLGLAGWADPAGAASRVMALETRLAAGHWDKVTNRDPVKTYTLVDLRRPGRAEPRRRLGRLPGRPRRLRARRSTRSSSASPTTSARWRLRSPTSRSRRGATGSPGTSCTRTRPTCPRRRRGELRLLRPHPVGVPEMRERWKRGVSLVEESLGEAVGQLYVERHFPPHAKEHMVELVGNLVEAFRRSLAEVPWMGDATRREALAKLDRSPRRSATPTAGATTPPSRSGPTTCSATSGGPWPSRSTDSSPSSAARSTATSGS